MATFWTKITNIPSKIADLIWHTSVKRAEWWKRFLVRGARIGIAVFRDLSNGMLSLRAMSLVYTTVISLVPLLALSFSVLKGFGVHNQIQPFLLRMLSPLGPKSVEVTEKIIEFVDNSRVGVLGVVGLALLIYSVIAMMQKIEASFNDIWRISKGRPLAQRFSDYLSVTLIGPLLLFLSIGLTTYVRNTPAITYLSDSAWTEDLLAFAGILLPYLLMSFAFTFIYYFMPNTRVKILSALVGGLITAVIWKTMGWAFSEFIATSDNKTAVYSAFASIIIFMVYLYVGWLVLLIGASISYYHQNPQNVRIAQRQRHYSNQVKEKAGLCVLYLIGREFFNEHPAWTAEKLTRRLQLPINLIEEILQIFVQKKFLTESKEAANTFIPAKPMEKIFLSDVLHAIRSAEESREMHTGQIVAPKPIKALIEDYERHMEQATGTVTLRDLIDQDEGSEFEEFMNENRLKIEGRKVEPVD